MFKGTTIVSVRRGNHVVIVGDGQVSMNQTVVKGNANKLRTLGNGSVIAGFAGSTADAFLLFEMFEEKLAEHQYHLTRGAVEMAKSWRSDKMLQKLEALLLVADKEQTLMISGSGDVLEPEYDVIAIGSGGSYALAAARALHSNTDMDPKAIGETAIKIAADICVYTNDALRVLELRG